MGIDVILDLNSVLEKFRANKVYNKEKYEELLTKYEEAVQRIDELEKTIPNLQKKTLPSSEEIESMKAVLELFGIEKLDTKGIQQLSRIRSLVGGVNG